MGRSRTKPDSDESGKTTPSQPSETIEVKPGETATGEATGDGSGVTLPDATPDADGVTRTMFEHDPATGESTPIIGEPHDGGLLTEDTAAAEAAQASFAAASPEEKATLLGLGTTVQPEDVEKPSDGDVPPVLSTKTLDELEAEEVEEARQDRMKREIPSRPVTKLGKAIHARIHELFEANENIDARLVAREVGLKVLGREISIEEAEAQEREAFEHLLSLPEGVKRYRVWPHGPLNHDGQEHKPGDELDLPEHIGKTIACLEEI